MAHILRSVGAFVLVLTAAVQAGQIGQEVAIPRHLQAGEEFTLSLHDLLEHGQKLFTAVWTDQEGGGRPLTKGTGSPVVDPSNQLTFPRNFNRVSAPDADSCAGCHNVPVNGGGDIVSNVFVLGQRFDFATFNSADFLATSGAVAGLPGSAAVRTGFRHRIPKDPPGAAAGYTASDRRRGGEEKDVASAKVNRRAGVLVVDRGSNSQ